MTFEDILNFFDFSYEKKADGYALIDLQEANLGLINDERFYNAEDMINRLVDSVYGDDYLFDDKELTETGCVLVSEYIEKFGNDKEGHEYLYHCLHPEELKDLPETLDEDQCNKILEDARKQAFLEAEEVLKAKGFCYMGDTSLSDHSIQMIGFYTEVDMVQWMMDGIPRSNSGFYSVDVDKYMPQNLTLSKS